MTEFKIETVLVMGVGPKFQIKGLINPEKQKLDTVLWLMGLHESCDTLESVVESLYRCLYDEYQINDNIKEGDTFVVEPQTKYNGIRIPELRFRTESFHVLPDCEISTKILAKD